LFKYLHIWACDAADVGGIGSVVAAQHQKASSVKALILMLLLLPIVLFL
jgi:hypothetical protein